MNGDMSSERIRLQAATLAELGIAGPDGLTAARVARRAGVPEELVNRLYPDLATLLYESVTGAIETIAQRILPSFL